MLLCVVVPLCGVGVYIRSSMEQFIQEKLSEKVLQNIARNERTICDELQNLAFLSNAFVYDEELRERMMGEEYTEYENTAYFNQIISKMYINGGYDETKGIKIIMFDKWGRVYSNWSMNYHDYQFLLEQDWVKESEKQGGHAVWSMFSPAYVAEDQERGERYISLAKSILADGTSGSNIGTLIISIEQYQFSKLLMNFAYEDDLAYVCVDKGEVLLSNDQDGIITSKDIQDIYQDTVNLKSGNTQICVNKKEYLVSYYTIPKPWVFNNQQMKVFHYTDYEEVNSQMKHITNKMNITLLIACSFIILIAYMVTRLLVRPIELLTKQMEEYQLDSTIFNIDVHRKDEIGKLNKAFCTMSDNIKKLFLKLEEENEIKEKYRYESLRAQLNPHFLFNTLTTIRWMAIIRGADNIVDSIDALAHMLKYSMGRDNSEVTLKEELDNIQNYVYIQNCRYGEHCSLDIVVGKELEGLRTMKFILQPIVENAVIHGYDKQQEQIKVQIQAAIERDSLIIIVEDDGVGMPEDKIDWFQASKQSRVKESKLTGIGLTNVDECIRITYGDAYGLTIDANRKVGTKIVFRLPVILGEDRISEEGNDS